MPLCAFLVITEERWTQLVKLVRTQDMYHILNELNLIVAQGLTRAWVVR